MENGNRITAEELLREAGNLQASGRLEEARGLLMVLIAQFPDLVPAQFMLSGVLSDLGSHAAAALLLERLVAGGQAPEAVGPLVEAYRKAGAYDHAENLLRQLIRPDAPCNRWLAMVYGQMLIERQELDKALSLFVPLAARPELVDVARAVVGDALQIKGQLGSALEVLLPVAWSNWSHTFVSLSLAQLRNSMAQCGETAARRPHPYPGSDIGVTVSSLGYFGRFGQQLCEYLFMRCLADRAGVPLETPEWVGHYVFELDDPLPTGRRVQEKRSAAWLEERVAAEGAQVLAGRDFFSPGSFPDWKPEYTLRARELFRLRPCWSSRLMPALDRLRQRGETVVALHIRRTDQSTRFRLPSNEWYRNWLRDIWPTLTKPVLYVSSDDIGAVLGDFAEFDPLSVNDIAEPWPGLEWLQEFVVLMHADIIALSQSAFSYYACMLNSTGRLFVQPDMERECLVPYSPLLHDRCQSFSP